MKQHLILKLKKSLDIGNLHWSSAVKGDVKLPEQTIKAIDDIFKKYNIDYFISNEYLCKTHNLWSKDEISAALNRTYRVILQKDYEIPVTLIEELKSVPEIEMVRLASIAVVDLPMASSFSFATNEKYDRARKEIYLDEAHLLTKGNKTIKIAILDTGVWANHPEYKDNLQDGFDFVDIIDGTPEALAKQINANESVFGGDFTGIDEDFNDPLVGHGTHVTGIIAAKGINMSLGVAPNCTIIPVKVLAALKQGEKYVGAGLVDNINNGIKWAIDKGADVINMSLGIKHEAGGLPHAEIIEYAKTKNVTVVAASGNDGSEESYYPGALPHVLAVGASDENNEIAFFSTYGKQVSFVAPGTNIRSSFLNDSYSNSTGTSHASPFVAGAVALLKSYAFELGHKLSDSQVKYILKSTADKPFEGIKNKKWGYGKLNIIDALKLLQYKLNKN
jgi:thermitase